MPGQHLADLHPRRLRHAGDEAADQCRIGARPQLLEVAAELPGSIRQVFDFLVELPGSRDGLLGEQPLSLAITFGHPDEGDFGVRNGPPLELALGDLGGVGDLARGRQLDPVKDLLDEQRTLCRYLESDQRRHLGDVEAASGAGEDIAHPGVLGGVQDPRLVDGIDECVEGGAWARPVGRLERVLISRLGRTGGPCNQGSEGREEGERCEASSCFGHHSAPPASGCFVRFNRAGSYPWSRRRSMMPS